MLKALVLSLAVGGLVACATEPAVKSWWTLNHESFTPVTPGLSKADVERQLGKPILISNFPRLAEEVWDYRYLEGSTRIYLTEIHFDRQGLVKYYAQYPDPAYNRRR